MRVGTCILKNSLLTVNTDMYNHSRFPLSVQLGGLYVVAIFLPSVVEENVATDFICLAATPLGVHGSFSLFATAATF